jgi:hypothetical protein
MTTTKKTTFWLNDEPHVMPALSAASPTFQAFTTRYCDPNPLKNAFSNFREFAAQHCAPKSEPEIK